MSRANVLKTGTAICKCYDQRQSTCNAIQTAAQRANYEDLGVNQLRQDRWRSGRKKGR